MLDVLKKYDFSPVQPVLAELIASFSFNNN